LDLKDTAPIMDTNMQLDEPQLRIANQSLKMTAMASEKNNRPWLFMNFSLKTPYSVTLNKTDTTDKSA